MASIYNTDENSEDESDEERATKKVNVGEIEGTLLGDFILKEYYASVDLRSSNERSRSVSIRRLKEFQLTLALFREQWPVVFIQAKKE